MKRIQQIQIYTWMGEYIDSVQLMLPVPHVEKAHTKVEVCFVGLIDITVGQAYNKNI